MSLPAYSGNQAEWNREAKRKIDPRINGYPFPEFDFEPANVRPGFTYYDSTLGKVRTYAGGVWNNHF